MRERERERGREEGRGGRRERGRERGRRREIVSLASVLSASVVLLHPRL